MNRPNPSSSSSNARPGSSKARRTADHAVKNVRLEKEHLYDLFMQVPACIAILTGPDLVYELANPDYRRLFGLSRKIEGRPLAEVIPDLDEELLGVVHRVATQGKRVALNEQPVTIDWDGADKVSTKYFNLAFEPVFESGKPNGLMVFAIDITEQVNARQKIKESEAYYREMTDNMPIMTWLTGPDDKGAYLNKQWFEYTGQDPNSNASPEAGLIAAAHPDDLEEAFSAFFAASKKRQPFSTEYRLKNKAGEYRWVLEAGLPRFDTNGRFMGYVGSIIDIHERKQAEEAMRASEERLRFMAESMPQKIFTIMPDGKMGYFNPQWVDYSGLTMAQPMKGDPVEYGIIHPNDLESVMKSWRTAWRTGKPIEFEYRLRRKDGVYRWHISRINPMKDENGNIIMWIGSVTDVDDMKRAIQKEHELEIETAMLTKQSQELIELNHAKDEFISLASHQLRTPATGVKQYIGMLLQGYIGELTNEQKAFLRTAYDSNERQLAIVNDLLQVAQVDAGKVRLQKSKTDLIRMIEDIIDEQASKFAERHQKVVFKPSVKKLPIMADEDRIRMVLENIIDNAGKYTHPDRTITVSVTAAARAVRIAVKDQGVGMAPANINKAFNKFTRLDNPLSRSSEGSGLGLYWAKKIVDLHNGSIKVKSALGKGTTFTVTLPSEQP